MAFRIALWGRVARAKTRGLGDSHSRHKPDLTVFLDRDLYFDNDTLRATLLVQSQEEFSYPVLSVALVCHWESHDTSIPASLRSTTLYSHKKVLGEPFVVAAHPMTIHFEFKFPDELLPPSFNSACGKIEWEIAVLCEAPPDMSALVMLHRQLFQKACLYYPLAGHTPTVQAERVLDLPDENAYTIVKTAQDENLRDHLSHLSLRRSRKQSCSCEEGARECTCNAHLSADLVLHRQSHSEPHVDDDLISAAITSFALGETEERDDSNSTDAADSALQWSSDTDRGYDVLDDSASRESFQRAALRHEQAACALWVKASLSQDMYESGQPVQVTLGFGSMHEASLVDKVDVQVVQTVYAEKEDTQIAFQTCVLDSSTLHPRTWKSRKRVFCMMPSPNEDSESEQCAIQTYQGGTSLAPSMWRQTDRALVSVRYELNISVSAADGSELHMTLPFNLATCSDLASTMELTTDSVRNFIFFPWTDDPPVYEAHNAHSSPSWDEYNSRVFVPASSLRSIGVWTRKDPPEFEAAVKEKQPPRRMSSFF